MCNILVAPCIYALKLHSAQQILYKGKILIFYNNLPMYDCMSIKLMYFR